MYFIQKSRAWAVLIILMIFAFSCQKLEETSTNEDGETSEFHCKTEKEGLEIPIDNSSKVTARSATIVPVILVPSGSRITATEYSKIRFSLESIRLWYQRELQDKDLRWDKLQIMQGAKTAAYYRTNNNVWSEIPNEMQSKLGWNPWASNSDKNRVALIIGVDLGGWAGGSGGADGRGLAILGTDGLFGRGSAVGQWFATQEMFVGTAIHELGHALTLPHSSDRNSIMNFHGDYKVKHLNSTERSKVRALQSTVYFNTHPMARWTFDDNSGSNRTVIDETGNGNNLVANYAVSFGRGLYEQTGIFDGSNSNATSANNRCSVSSGVTISAWVFPYSGKSTGSIVNKWYAKDSYFLGVRNGRYEFSIALPGGTWGQMKTISAPINYRWQHIVASYDGKTMRLYVDGKLKSTRAVYGTIQQSSRPVVVGNHPNGNGFKGMIDGVTLYNRGVDIERILNY